MSLSRVPRAYGLKIRRRASGHSSPSGAARCPIPWHAEGHGGRLQATENKGLIIALAAPSTILCLLWTIHRWNCAKSFHLYPFGTCLPRDGVPAPPPRLENHSDRPKIPAIVRARAFRAGRRLGNRGRKFAKFRDRFSLREISRAARKFRANSSFPRLAHLRIHLLPL